MRHNVLADVFGLIKNMEAIGRREAVTPASNLARDVLKVMQAHQYIGDFEYVDDGRGGKFRVHLLGKINDCNVVLPHFSLQKDEFISWEKQFLPAAGIGILILSTSKGVMDHAAAKNAGVGGKLLGYVY